MKRHLFALATGLVIASMPTTTSAQATGQDRGARRMQDTAMKGMKHDMSGMKESNTPKTGQMGGSWREMDAFHSLLMAVYHPARKDTLQPLRLQASVLANVAAKWSASSPPASCNSEDTRGKVAAIAKESKALAGLVETKASDAALKKSITAVHDLFEPLAHECGMMGMKH